MKDQPPGKTAEILMSCVTSSAAAASSDVVSRPASEGLKCNPEMEEDLQVDRPEFWFDDFVFPDRLRCRLPTSTWWWMSRVTENAEMLNGFTQSLFQSCAKQFKAFNFYRKRKQNTYKQQRDRIFPKMKSCQNAKSGWKGNFKMRTSNAIILKIWNDLEIYFFSFCVILPIESPVKKQSTFKLELLVFNYCYKTCLIKLTHWQITRMFFVLFYSPRGHRHCAHRCSTTSWNSVEHDILEITNCYGFRGVDWNRTQCQYSQRQHFPSTFTLLSGCPQLQSIL